MAVTPESAHIGPALIVDGHPVVGFDLGTTFSKAAFIDQAYLPRLVPLGGPHSRGDDRFQMPSVGVLRSDRMLVGDELPAAFEADDIPIRLPKRFLADTRPRFPENSPRFSAAEICAQIFRRLKARTELHLKRPVRRVVLTIPPSFGSRQRQALIQAAGWADLDVIDLVEEPVAAAVYDWMVERRTKPGDNRAPLGVKYADIRAGKANMLVFDLGGGTLDISLLSADGMNIQVLESWAGGEFLGGADFTQAIADWIASEIRGRTAFDPIYHLAARDKVLQAAEVMKRELAQAEKSTRTWKERDVKLELTVDKYNRVIEPLLNRAQTAIYQAGQSAEKQLFEPVKHLLVVGAGSRARGVGAMIESLDSNRIGSRETPEDGSFWVALGAAATGYLHLQKSDLAPPANGSTPPRIFQLRRKSVLNLGIVAWDSKASDYCMRVILKANAQLPAEKTVSFGKVKFNQKKVRLRVVESPTKLLADSKSVGEFLVETDQGVDDLAELKYQTETPRDNDPDRDDELKVTLAYDITGRVRVSVLDRRTSKKSSRTLDPAPVNADCVEEQLATAPLPKPPAVETSEDEIKRMRRQILQLRSELKKAADTTTRITAEPPPIPEFEQIEYATGLANIDIPLPAIPVLPDIEPEPVKPPALEPRPQPAPSVVLDLDDDDLFDNRPLQTLFDDDSVVLDALSGPHAPTGTPKAKAPSAEPQSPAFEPASPVINLGMNLRMNDARLVGLNYSLKLILLELVKHETWPWDEFSRLCNAQQSQPKFVFERLNQWADRKYKTVFLTRSEETLTIHSELLT